MRQLIVKHICWNWIHREEVTAREHTISNEGKKFINIILSFHQSNNAPWDINRTPNQVCASFSYCCCWLKMIYDEASIIKLHNYWWNSKVGFDVPFCLEATQYIMKGFFLRLYIKKFIIRYVLPTLQFFTCAHIFFIILSKNEIWWFAVFLFAFKLFLKYIK